MSFGIALLILNVGTAVAAERPAADSQTAPSSEQPPNRQWRYGGFADIGYLFDVNDPTKKPFRSRGTTWHLNELDVNILSAYVKKIDASRGPGGGFFTADQRRSPVTRVTPTQQLLIVGLILTLDSDYQR